LPLAGEVRPIYITEEYRAENIVTTDYHNWFIDTVQSFKALVREIYRKRKPAQDRYAQNPPGGRQGIRNQEP